MFFFSYRVLKNFLKVIIGVGMIYLIFLWSNQSGRGFRRNTPARHAFVYNSLQQGANEITGDERRIARHFAVDTLPGLMQKGLIKKYKRHQSGTILLVDGKIWKKRSRFFKESLLAEILVYNKVNGYELETRVMDHHSQRLYAHALSTDRKEFFD
jgi:hypothetical protein